MRFLSGFASPGTVWLRESSSLITAGVLRGLSIVPGRRNVLCYETGVGLRTSTRSRLKKEGGSMSLILIILLVVLLLGAVPSWPHSRSWGYYPSGLLGLVLLIVIILALTGRL